MLVEPRLKSYREQIDCRLDELLPSPEGEPRPLFEAMRYACLAPGKRFRPILTLASAEACGGGDALDFACAIEMVHCFSLIHDDLPALDNDDLRRGLPTTHKVFGEAVAILAGDALFALAFETVAAARCSPVAIQQACLTLARACGGLVAGEAEDILVEGQPPDSTVLQRIHSRKTAALLGAAARFGAIAAGSSLDIQDHLDAYGRALGLAFQIADDILNETGSAEQLGKAAGSDKHREKMTYPAMFGLEASKAEASRVAQEAISHLERLPGNTTVLVELARFSIQRLV